MDTSVENRKHVRFRTLAAMYKDKHCGGIPEDMFDTYLLRLLSDLGEVYDDNHIKAREHRNSANGNKKLLDVYQKREKFLNKLSLEFRAQLGLVSRVVATATIRPKDEIK